MTPSKEFARYKNNAIVWYTSIANCYRFSFNSVPFVYKKPKVNTVKPRKEDHGLLFFLGCLDGLHFKMGFFSRWASFRDNVCKLKRGVSFRDGILLEIKPTGPLGFTVGLLAKSKRFSGFAVQPFRQHCKSSNTTVARSAKSTPAIVPFAQHPCHPPGYG